MGSPVKIFVMLVATFVAANVTFAQSVFTNIPRDTIVDYVSLGNGRLFTFQQFATNSNTLNLSWKQIAVSTPSQWEVTLCDNGNCYPNLPLSGTMAPVSVGDYGLMTLDVKPHTTPGTAIVRYSIWDASAPSVIDTLTWIIHATTTGIGNVTNELPKAFLVSKFLFLSLPASPNQEAVLYDMTGKAVVLKHLSLPHETIDLSAINNGLYVLKILSPKFNFTQKLFIGAF